MDRSTQPMTEERRGMREHFRRRVSEGGDWKEFGLHYGKGEFVNVIHEMQWIKYTYVLGPEIMFAKL